ncbi:YgaP family membrane protein [Tepidibacillus fermentans]|uniref:DUF2892 family protein n=1 Tax=Tepidibacillus fermentans TaxID=1281767 RepID=A0A4R3KHH7_9BACI|nr:DUF2892 domain-containing protein [Tepidibacillus fermentans]TCS82489.1 DUF2892 family protein [Tepidibacillus fermentans]
MKQNVGTIDRIIRVILGVILLALLFTDISFRNFGWIGVIPLLTGAIGYCPLYSIFKIKTN